MCGCAESLQDLLLVSGKSAGAGHCLWANEFEIGVITLPNVCVRVQSPCRTCYL
jgi:hypothetical protein